MKYIIITPAKNEQDYIEETLKSVVKQTILPKKWVIVDDGSEDKTKEIANRFALKHPWIQVISSGVQNKRDQGTPIIHAFYAGYELVKETEWDFIVKLDADLTLPKDYFESIIENFNADPKIGLCGGYCSEFVNGQKKKIYHAPYHIRGAFKSIRRECWKEIGGFKAVIGWDGLDEMTAMFYGWKTKNIDKEVIHHRPASGSYQPQKLAYKIGYSKYKNGSNFFLTIIRALRRLGKRPFGLYAAYYLYGYFSALMRKENKNVSPELAKFINNFHLKRLFLLKQ